MRETDKLKKDYDEFLLQFDRGIAIDSAAKIDLVLKLQRMWHVYIAFLFAN